MTDIGTQHQTDRLNRLSVLIGWVFLFAICVFAYWQGLNGPFVMDDFGSISALGDRGGVIDWDTFKAFVFGGNAGPTGRPLALLSFLIDANNWPTDAWPFKRTNLIIHLINGALLGVLIARILAVLGFDKRGARWIALASAAGWLLHPFLVSTTLYAVQRMAQLSTLFIFAGLITYLYGRTLVALHATKAYLIMSISIGLFTFLSMISKENGILLPLLVAIVEFTIVAGQKLRFGRLNRAWMSVFILLPTGVIATYLGMEFFRDHFFVVVPPRDYSVYERLLTQPRILIDYLHHWFIPELYTTGIFQDHFTKSTGLFSPITTILSALFHVSMISLALVKRRKWPLFCLAVLFFYGSHALESSVINLELYFEHRNYLAAAFLFLPLFAALQEKATHRIFLVVTLCVVFLLAGFTRYSATVWADYSSIVEASARKAPTSARAQAQYATQLFNAQRYGESVQVIERAIENIPNGRPQLLRNLLIFRCYMGDLPAQDFEQAAALLSSRPYDARSIEIYTVLASAVVENRCPDVSMDAVRAMFANMLLVRQNADPDSLAYSQIQYLIGFVDVHRDKPSQAVAAFEKSLRARPGAGHAMIMAAHLATGEYFDEALYFSNLARSQLEGQSQSFMRGPRVSEADINEFQAVIRADQKRQPAVDTARPIP